MMLRTAGQASNHFSSPRRLQYSAIASRLQQSTVLIYCRKNRVKRPNGPPSSWNTMELCACFLWLNHHRDIMQRRLYDIFRGQDPNNTNRDEQFVDGKFFVSKWQGRTRRYALDQ